MAKRKQQHPNMAIRRLLLDGVKIIEPYRRALLQSHRNPNGGMDDKAVEMEQKLMLVWVRMARDVALRLKRSAPGK